MSNSNYAGIPDEYAGIDNASIVLIPVPYDGTSTWQKGADKRIQKCIIMESFLQMLLQKTVRQKQW